MPSRSSRVVCLVAVSLVLAGAAGCGTGVGSSAREESPSSIVPSSTTSTSVIAGCPPGCSLPSDFDAITALASTATQVSIITVTAQGSRTDAVLQGDINHLAYSSGELDLTKLAGFPANPAIGTSYVVFTSYDRGGACLSAIFTYDAKRQVAKFSVSFDGYVSDKILLRAEPVTIPNTISLYQLRRRLSPTGGPTYPTNTSESLCPGP